MSAADTRFMTLALSLGRRGLGRTWPNPAVGAVIVKDGRIVGRGWTQPGGRPHAEVVALAQAGKAAKGATLYVTLEPCSHEGKSPPCADAIVAAGIARVVSAIEDPDPRVSGQGHERLRRAGVSLTIGTCADQARADHAGFLLRQKDGRPFVTLKLASSFDGRIATGAGESQWITGPEARRMVHALRASHDAVLVGGGTARADDPLLTVRGLGIQHQPVRIVASRRLKLPEEGAMAASAGKHPLWIMHGTKAAAGKRALWEAKGARCLAVPVADAGYIDAAAMLKVLAGEGITRVFCEGGGALAASLLQDGLVDELVGFTAGLALGAEGRPSLGPMGLARLDEAPRFDLIETRAIGADVMHRWQRRKAQL